MKPQKYLATWKIGSNKSRGQWMVTFRDFSCSMLQQPTLQNEKLDASDGAVPGVENPNISPEKRILPT